MNHNLFFTLSRFFLIAINLLISVCISSGNLKSMKVDVMQLGYQLIAPTPQPEIYFDDLIHLKNKLNTID